MDTSGLIAVFRRECRQMMSRPIYIFSSFVVMAVSCVFFLTVMNEGLPERLPVGIVDHDHTSISRMVRRELDAGQMVEIVQEYADYTEARQAMQRGEIYSFIELPEGMYSDILAQKRPCITIYTNDAYLLGGMLSYRQLMTIANLSSGAMQREILRKKGMREEVFMPVIQPIVIDSHLLGNPWANYPVYLATTILPGILGLMVLVLCLYSLMREMKGGSSEALMQIAGGNVHAAIIGKMLPYTIIFVMLGWGLNVVLFKFMHFPMNGSFAFMCVAIAAYILALQAIAVFLAEIVPVPRVAICLGVLYGVLAFSLSGFTYPVEYMLPAIQAWAQCFPLRHYYMLTVDQMLMGLPWQASYLRLCILLATVLLPICFAWRLKKAYLYRNYPED